MDDRVEQAILADGQKEVLVDYSAYTTRGEDDEPIDNLDEVAIKGQIVVFAEEDGFYGGKKSKSYVSPVLTDPTWLTLSLHANRAIVATNDHHHVFFEGVDKVEEEDLKVYREHIEALRDVTVDVYDLVMGS